MALSLYDAQVRRWAPWLRWVFDKRWDARFNGCDWAPWRSLGCLSQRALSRCRHGLVRGGQRRVFRRHIGADTGEGLEHFGLLIGRQADQLAAVCLETPRSDGPRERAGLLPVP
jgi:hypothetical protein